MNESNERDSRIKKYAHYKKINIFGCSEVGKSSLILSIQNTKNFKRRKKKCLKNGICHNVMTSIKQSRNSFIIIITT